jgi:serine phosphatase RsbU (regulator of sigma subunit)
VRVGQRLLVLVVVGVVMTLALVASAMLAVSDVSAVNHELARVSRALNHHKTADEMHDALRADVARAQLVGTGQLAEAPAAVRREARQHAARFRAASRAASAVDLPAPLEQALMRLHSVQETYIQTAGDMVTSALSPRGVSPGAQTAYEAAYRFLAPELSAVTRRLMATTAQVEARAVQERDQAERTIAVTAAAVLAGWLALAGWHHRSTRHLQAALVREAEQRSMAELLQGSLLPAGLPRVSGAELAARSVPGNAEHRVGGDWYDAIHLPTGEVLLVVGDVVGHDLPAATVMGQLRNSLRAYALEDSSAATMLARVNRAALLLGTSDLATCIVVVLDPATMTARWASAGHPPPLLASTAGARRILVGEPGPPLGVTPRAEYVEHAVELGAGQTLLLYSDGLVERRGVPIDVGMSRLESIPLPDTGPEAVCDYLIETMVGAGPHPDDVTCLLLRVDARPAAAPDGVTAAPAGSPLTCA